MQSTERKEHQEFYKNPVSAKLCFKNKGEINTFQDKNRESVATQSALQEILTEILQDERK